MDITDRLKQVNDDFEKILGSSVGKNNLDRREKEARLYDLSLWSDLRSFTGNFVDEDGHVTNILNYEILRRELVRLSTFQKQTFLSNDITHLLKDRYASLYEELLLKPALKSYISEYLHHVSVSYDVLFRDSDILSVGCATGLTEKFLIDNYRVPRDNMLGIDASPLLIKMAQKRITAMEMDVSQMPPVQNRQLILSPMNYLHYYLHPGMEQSIQRISQLLFDGGYFIADFITPDSLRNYSPVLISENMISFRDTNLIEEKNNLYQETRVINVIRPGDRVSVSNEGRTLRYLPSMWKVRYYLKKLLGGDVDFYDANNLQKLKIRDETASTGRYVAVVRKKT